MAGPPRNDVEVLHDLFAHAPLPYQSLDRTRRILHVNEAWLELLGYEEDEVVGRRADEFLDPATAALIEDRFERFVAAGRIRGTEIVFLRKDGTPVVTQLDGRIVRDDEGRFLRTHCIIRDVTEERAALARLADSEHRFRTLVETAQEGIWQVDAAGVTVYANPAMARMLGGTPADMAGRSMDDFMDAGAAEQVRCDMERRRGLAEQRDVVLRARDGHPVPTTMALAPLTDRDGTFTGSIAGVMDMTDRVQYDRKMLQAQKLESLAVMAGGIAHDFNNLLQTVMGNADLALAQPGLGKEATLSLQAIRTATSQAAGLCRQMLAYAGKGRYAKEPVALDALVDDMAGLLRTSVSRKAQLRVDVQRGLPVVEADPVQLRQVLMNLVTNASEALGGAGGRVTVSVRRRRLGRGDLDAMTTVSDHAAGDYVVVAVTDDGCGMSEEVAASVFDPFFTTKFTGRGLGMAVVHGVAQAHGGWVVVDSEPGRGTAVEVYLPTGAVAAVPPRPPAEVRRSTGTALLADDERQVRDVAARMLASLGWEVDMAADGEEAARLVEEDPERFDLVILDWSMPVLDGREAMLRIRAAAPGLPVVVSSGHAATTLRERFDDLAPVGYLEKPFQLAELGEALAAHARRAGAG